MAVNMCKMVAYGLLVLLCVSLCYADEQGQTLEKYVVDVTKEDFDSFKNQPVVQMLYFYKRGKTKSTFLLNLPAPAPGCMAMVASGMWTNCLFLVLVEML